MNKFVKDMALVTQYIKSIDGRPIIPPTTIGKAYATKNSTGVTLLADIGRTNVLSEN